MATSAQDNDYTESNYGQLSTTANIQNEIISSLDISTANNLPAHRIDKPNAKCLQDEAEMHRISKSVTTAYGQHLTPTTTERSGPALPRTHLYPSLSIVRSDHYPVKCYQPSVNDEASTVYDLKSLTLGRKDPTSEELTNVTDKREVSNSVICLSDDSNSWIQVIPCSDATHNEEMEDCDWSMLTFGNPSEFQANPVVGIRAANSKSKFLSRIREVTANVTDAMKTATRRKAGEVASTNAAGDRVKWTSENCEDCQTAKWTCSRCTLENSVRDDVCAVCQYNERANVMQTPVMRLHRKAWMFTSPH
jgi:hypothetical protein